MKIIEAPLGALSPEQIWGTDVTRHPFLAVLAKPTEGRNSLFARLNGRSKGLTWTD